MWSFLGYAVVGRGREGKGMGWMGMVHVFFREYEKVVLAVAVD